MKKRTNYKGINGILGLVLVDRVPEELQMEVHNIVREMVIKANP